MKKQLLLMTAIMCGTLIQAQRLNIDSLVKESKKTEQWEPVPAVVTPGKTNADAPSDAIVLFNGKDLNSFQKKRWRTARLEN